MNTRLRALVLLPAAALVLSGCSTAATDAPAEPTGIRVVSSTNVYGSIASAIGGEHVDVTSIIDSGARDPHSYEASAQDQLAVSKADVVIENGGGYDPFIDTLVDAAGSDDVEMVNVVDLSGQAPVDAHSDEDHAHEEGEDHAHAEGEEHEHIDGLNEHVWYDLAAADALASTLAHVFSHLDEENATVFAENYANFSEEIAALTASTDELKSEFDGTSVAVTEPVPLYLLEASGLVNVIPEEFSSAIEEGADVSPASLRDALAVFDASDIALLAYNEQTSSPQTEQVRDAAEKDAVPVVSFAETLPDGEDYVSWMTKNIAAIADALRS
ncbi:ABC transporter substrate-binding protein [Mycetocola manganoxydans]|uniref:ABC transporter substrate-binding protein n=1 Tax=Mycetocola manganoxydans TaxID=699879 RepID=A0A3L6ZZD6_9MICO|nr:zinc ABC transporter substrate-binding protein [Mycetocola manganoxydans]RLP73065.1 ABC transporter substrate-binding protein [Mycetocola manganoxydans]GHD44262.1 ABC transporter substrate-binding protein [Mycetocola manganoxydans]